jgi:aryl-alcohol dehydrogenase-like predicted oxidoreductase
MLRELAERHGASPAEIALAWLNSLSPSVVSIPGPTRIESVESVVRAHSIQFGDEERQRL